MLFMSKYDLSLDQTFPGAVKHDLPRTWNMITA